MSDGEQGNDAVAMAWLSRLLPRERLRAGAASVMHEGWVYKRSRHLGLWRRRWMVLTFEHELLTFEDDTQRGGITERLRAPQLQEALAVASGGSSSATPGVGVGEGAPVVVEGVRESRRRRLLKRLLPGLASGASGSRMRLRFDAGESANRYWRQCLRGSSRAGRLGLSGLQPQSLSTTLQSLRDASSSDSHEPALFGGDCDRL
eukprot:TRINITY_DN46746_c0_g1_i1.p1 TRINITY_DN46746_c0_g1~~TRINITY_DN46746_c0_g1_i1.p1  ORF type:complete len:204 (+),score=38.30 TRINITY_DN46746_c0_g1_i1:80-691(+)